MRATEPLASSVPAVNMSAAAMRINSRPDIFFSVCIEVHDYNWVLEEDNGSYVFEW